MNTNVFGFKSNCFTDLLTGYVLPPQAYNHVPRKDNRSFVTLTRIKNLLKLNESITYTNK